MRDRGTAALAATGVMALLAGMIVMGTAGTARAAGDGECVASPASTDVAWGVDSPGDGFERTDQTRFVETVPAVEPVGEVSHVERRYSNVVVTQAYQPAVYEVEYQFVLQHGQGNVRWERDPDWNANGNSSSSGWVGTGVTRNGALLTAEVLAVTATSYQWSTTDPGDPWEPTGETRTVVDRAAVEGSEAQGYLEYRWSRTVEGVTCDDEGAVEVTDPQTKPEPAEGRARPAVDSGEAPVVKAAKAAKPVVKGVQAVAGNNARVPLAVDAGFGGPTTGGASSTSLLGQGLLGGGLMLLLLAGWTRKGRLPRGAHQG